MEQKDKALEEIRKKIEEELKKFAKDLEDLSPYLKKKIQRVHSTTPQWETTSAGSVQEN